MSVGVNCSFLLRFLLRFCLKLADGRCYRSRSIVLEEIPRFAVLLLKKKTVLAKFDVVIVLSSKFAIENCVVIKKVSKKMLASRQPELVTCIAIRWFTPMLTH